MKRDFYTKFGIIMAGLFVVPLFTLTVQATYLDIDGDITVDISGSTDKPVNSYNVYIPNESGTAWITDPSYKIKDNSSLDSQIASLNLPKIIGNSLNLNKFYDSTALTNVFNKSNNPDKDIYVGYSSFFIDEKADDNLINEQLMLSEFENNYHFVSQKTIIHTNNLRIMGNYLCSTNYFEVYKIDNLYTKNGIYSLDYIYDEKTPTLSCERLLGFKAGLWNDNAANFKIYDNYNRSNKQLLFDLKNVETGVYEFDLDYKIMNLKIDRIDPKDGVSVWNWSGDINISNYTFEKTCMSCDVKNGEDWNYWTPDGIKGSWISI